MTTTTFALNCPICLDKLHDPVVTPCGHIGCDACIKAHARGSIDPYKATCPTCRAPFSIVMPDMSIVPTKYHTYISPPLRPVFLDAREDNSRAVIENPNAEIAALKGRVTSLERDNDLLTDRCESAQNAVASLTADERTARLALEDKQNLNHLRADTLEITRSVGLASAVKRTSGQVALGDDSPCSSGDNSSSFEPGSSTWTVKVCSNDRYSVIKPIPTRKRAKYVDASVERSSDTDTDF